MRLGGCYHFFLLLKLACGLCQIVFMRKVLNKFPRPACKCSVLYLTSTVSHWNSFSNIELQGSKKSFSASQIHLHLSLLSFPGSSHTIHCCTKVQNEHPSSCQLQMPVTQNWPWDWLHSELIQTLTSSMQLIA